MNKIPLLVFLCLILSSFALASLQDLGTFKKGDCVSLLQICDNCTFNNITSVRYPNNTIALKDKIMTINSNEFNYTFCDTSTPGTYIVNGVGDLNTINTVWNYRFFITNDGFSVVDNLPTIIVLVLFGMLFIGLGIYLFMRERFV